MLDPKLLRNDLDSVVEKLRIKKYEFNTELFNQLEDKRKALQMSTQALQSNRNAQSKAIGKAKSQGEDIAPLLAAVDELGSQLKQAETDLDDLQTQLETLLLDMPNIADDSVPAGLTEDDNEEVLVWGTKPVFDFEPKDHIDLGNQLKGLDFERAAKLSGARFATMTGSLATMHRALIQLMVNQHSQLHGYTEAYVPYLVNEATLMGTGQLPKFKDDWCNGKDDSNHLFLILTAEVSVTNLLCAIILAE